MGSEDLAEYAVVSSRLLLYLVEPVRVVRLCLRVGSSRLMRRIIVCQNVGRIAKKDLVVRSGQGNTEKLRETEKMGVGLRGCGEGSGCKEEKEDCRGSKRIAIGRRKMQHSPPEAKIVHNRCNPGRTQDSRGGDT